VWQVAQLALKILSPRRVSELVMFGFGGGFRA
jgi:hypothetical protein